MERTLVLIKPDAMQRGMAGEIISRLERTGLKIAAMKMIQMDEALAKRHYAIHERKPFFEKLVDYITSAPIIAVIFEGQNGIDIVRKTIGETDPVNAAPGTIRGDLALEIGRNLIHGSDSLENAKKEIDLFFSMEELLYYEREVDRWIIES